jgi:mono/diheme cytochrome c family protein
MRPLRLFLITTIMLIAACGTVATPQAVSIEEAHEVEATALPATLPPTLAEPTQAQPTTPPATLPPTVAQPTPTPSLTPTAEVQPTEAATHEEHTSSSTEPTADVSAIGDPANGEVLFNAMQSEVGFACATCHRVDSDQRLVGPSLMGVSEHAVHHNTGQNAVQYLYTSITDPGAYVVEGFIDRLMPRTYSEIFTPDEINDLIAYLLTL